VVTAKTFEGFDASMLHALVATSNHPVAKGVRNYLENNYSDLKAHPLEAIRSIQAKGIEAEFEGKKLIGGNAAYLEEAGILCDEAAEHTLFVFAIDGKVMARFELSDTIREDAKEAIAAIKALGIRVVMLTGDHGASAKKVAEAVGIEEVHARLLPQEKAAMIDRFHEEGHTVVMAGDGINDTIALARSDIAIALGSGADVAISVSDVVLLDEKMRSLYDAYRISRRTFRAVKENLGFSLLYNVVAVPLAMAGFVNPLVAALSMSMSSLIVVGNSMRIKLGSK